MQSSDTFEKHLNLHKTLLQICAQSKCGNGTEKNKKERKKQ